MDYGDLTVIIPTLNEERNIKELIKIIRNSYKGIKVVVADDGSTDNTAAIVKKFGMSDKNIKLLDRGREKTHGLTASVIDAVKNTKTKLRDGNDLVIGTREKVEGEWPLQRRLMSVIATNIARLRLMKAVKDPMSGFFGVRSELFKKALAAKEKRFEKRGYKVMFDLLKCAPMARTANVYYTFGKRSGGESKIGVKQVICFLKSVAKP